MVKSSCYDNNGLKKGAWSEDEDNKLRAYIQRYGHWNWALLPKFIGVSRSGKSCRLRWMNYLRPNIKHGNFTKEEDDLVIDLHNKLGNKWSTIAAKLPGRSDNEIKNRWNTHLKKRAQNEHTESSNEHLGTLEYDQASSKRKPVNKTDLKHQPEVGTTLLAGESSESLSYSSLTEISSCQLSDSDCAVFSDFTPLTFNDDELVDNFWSEPFLTDIDATTPSGNYNLLSPLNFVNEFSSQYSCQDLMMTDDQCLWSMMADSYVENNIFIN
ncbi:unnamed protein product [Lactuca virosa]|uniref:Uncharacterized protein n=1 Tax=Lactuca virosa TaxID=75947 RepID=A0AAU9LS07_9ASTR|nr:unnamed protein product [Lactuca virosa]